MKFVTPNYKLMPKNYRNLTPSRYCLKSEVSQSLMKVIAVIAVIAKIV
jgi:hypothetical protein